MPARVARAMLGYVNSRPGPLRHFVDQLDELRSSGVYSLILLGDDMLLFDREEYDPERGTWRALAPGDPGRANR
jgi:hypothetical protein